MSPNPLGGGHTASNADGNGSLMEGGFTVVITDTSGENPGVLMEGTALEVELDTNKIISLVAPQGGEGFKGFLLKLSGGDVDDTQAFMMPSPADPSGMVQTLELCAAESAASLAHTSPDIKPLIAGSFGVMLESDMANPTAMTPFTLEATVVVSNNATGSVWYHSSFEILMTEADDMEGPTMAPAVMEPFPVCNVCNGDPDQSPTNPDVVIPLANSTTCAQIYGAGLAGGISPEQCALVGNILTPCGCAPTDTGAMPSVAPSVMGDEGDMPSVAPSVVEDEGGSMSPSTTYMPTATAAPSFSPCYVCDDDPNQIMLKPEVVIPDGDVQCGVLYQAGLFGFFNETECGFIQIFVGPCECAPMMEEPMMPSASPSAMMTMMPSASPSVMTTEEPPTTSPTSASGGTTALPTTTIHQVMNIGVMMMAMLWIVA